MTCALERLPRRFARIAHSAGRLLAVCCAIALPSAALAETPEGLSPEEPRERAIVGRSQPVDRAPAPAEMFQRNDAWAWTTRFEVGGASFLKARLGDLALRSGDVLRVLDGRGREVERFEGPSRGSPTLWTLSAFGEVLQLDLSTRSPAAAPAFRVTDLLIGDSSMLAAAIAGPTKSICAPTDFEDAGCFLSDPGKERALRATAGLIRAHGGTAVWCSGSNVSSGNLLLTNQHCLESQAACDDAEFVFGYRRDGCGDAAAPVLEWTSFRCDEIVASSPFVDCEIEAASLDFALASMHGDPAADFGWIEPDPRPLLSGEAIYVAQHPSGRPLEVTHGDAEDVVVDGLQVRTFDTLDTDLFSSGAPMLRELDDRLVGLHHCGGCADPAVGNRGISMAALYPSIETHVCPPEVALRPAGFTAPTEVAGNGDALLDPGEVWRTAPRVRNASCFAVAFDAVADVVPGTESVPLELLDTVTTFGSIVAGEVAVGTPIRFRVADDAGCAGDVVLDLVDWRTATGLTLADAERAVVVAIGGAEVTTLLSERFVHGIPTSWTVVDGGTGSERWRTDDPGARGVLTPPFAIVDSRLDGAGVTQDETLRLPPLAAAGARGLELRFEHSFRHWPIGGDERALVEVRSARTDDLWLTVARWDDADDLGTQTIDLAPWAADGLEIRFRYLDASHDLWWAIDDVAVRNVIDRCTPPDQVFGDGFESGNGGAWDRLVGAASPGAIDPERLLGTVEPSHRPSVQKPSVATTTTSQ
ncbi:MAG: trypsin-like peptidase domain-containing protein [Acidobacteriota bacterium]